MNIKNPSSSGSYILGQIYKKKIRETPVSFSKIVILLKLPGKALRFTLLTPY